RPEFALCDELLGLVGEVIAKQSYLQKQVQVVS
ncbi:unnamed protein product, partial [marine sediment metagenome]